MTFPVYAVRDLCTTFMSPMVHQTEEDAVRSFSYMVNNPGIPNFSPSDFQLFKVGEFDNEKGRLIPLDLVELVCSGPDVAAKKGVSNA